MCCAGAAKSAVYKTHTTAGSHKAIADSRGKRIERAGATTTPTSSVVV